MKIFCSNIHRVYAYLCLIDLLYLYNTGTIYMLPTLSSYTLDEMLEVRQPGQVQFGQLYVNAKRERTKEYVQRMAVFGVVVTSLKPRLVITFNLTHMNL